MSVEQTLRRLYKRKKYADGCVAFGFSATDNKMYYAVHHKADTEQSPYLPEIKNIIGQSPIFCGYSNSFSVLEPDVPDITNCFTDPFYSFLKDHKRASLCFKLVNPEVSANKPRPSGYNDGYFTCAERKIIGLVRNRVTKIYTTKPPCYHCLPTIMSVYYLYENKEVRHIQKCNSSTTSDGRTIIDYKS